MQRTLTIPEDHFAACAAASPPVPTVGNAAANTQNYLDLTGQDLAPAPLPAGFTPRGIVALVFSCVAGLMGVSVIAWYGLGEFGAQQLQHEKTVIDATARATGVDTPLDQASVNASQERMTQMTEGASVTARQ